VKRGRPLRLLALLAGTLAAASLARADAADEVARLAGAIAALDADQRDVLLLHAWGELSQSEIATALQIPVGTVYSRLSRARASLRRAASEQPSSEAKETHR